MGVPHMAHDDYFMSDRSYSILCSRITMRRFMSGSLYDVSRTLPCSERTMSVSCSKSENCPVFSHKRWYIPIPRCLGRLWNIRSQVTGRILCTAWRRFCLKQHASMGPAAIRPPLHYTTFFPVPTSSARRGHINLTSVPIVVRATPLECQNSQTNDGKSRLRNGLIWALA
ncbi:hypothetical protein BJX96DRAFT_144176 [Aspergillus floccosus]